MTHEIIVNPDSYSSAFYEPIVSEDRYIILYGGRGCFAKKTKIQTPNGLKKICNVKENDLVYSVNTETKAIEQKKVLNVFKYENKDKCIRINYDNKIIICTLDHRFYYKGEFVEIAKILKENGINIIQTSS